MKLQRKEDLFMQHEYLTQIFDHLTKDWDRNETRSRMVEILTKKQNIVNKDEQLYFKSLLNNIAYLVETAKPIYLVIEECLENKRILTEQFAKSFVMEQQNKITL